MTASHIRSLDIAARIFIGLLFLYGGFGKLMDPGALATRLGSVGFPLPTLVGYFAIAFELAAPIALIAKRRCHGNQNCGQQYPQLRC